MKVNLKYFIKSFKKYITRENHFYKYLKQTSLSIGLIYFLNKQMFF